MKVLITKEQLNRIKTIESDLAEQEDGGGEGMPSYPQWETGIDRGPANPIGVTKWSEVVSITRGKANPLP
jgi:hypothetical protein